MGLGSESTRMLIWQGPGKRSGSSAHSRGAPIWFKTMAKIVIALFDDTKCIAIYLF
jgi:hypothetical protein